MGRVFFRSWQLRAAVILLILLGFGLLPGVAKATTPPSGTVPTSGNQPITFTAPNCDPLNGGNPGSNFCLGGSHPSTSPTTGDCSLIDPNPTPANPCPIGTSPTACTLQPYDTGNSICEHFQLTVAQSGTVSVCITYPTDLFGFTEIDIFAVQVTGFTTSDVAVGVAADTTTSTTGPTPGPTPGTAQLCTGNFSAAAETFFDIQLNPGFLIGPIPTGQISGTINFTTSGGGGAGGGGGGTPPPPSGPKFTGGGKLPDSANLSMNVTNTALTTGKVRFKLSAVCSVASTSFTLVDVEGGGTIPGGSGSNGTAHVKGNGNNMNGQGVSFEIHQAADNGEGSSQTTPDKFDITITGPDWSCTEPIGTSLQNGNLQYHP
jgi:hypothetical protein